MGTAWATQPGVARKAGPWPALPLPEEGPFGLQPQQGSWACPSCVGNAGSGSQRVPQAALEDADALGYLRRNACDRHVVRMQKDRQGSRGSWDNVKKSSVMLVSSDPA